MGGCVGSDISMPKNRLKHLIMRLKTTVPV